MAIWPKKLCVNRNLQKRPASGSRKSRFASAANDRFPPIVNIGVFKSKVAEGPQRPRSIYLIGRLFGIPAENRNHPRYDLHLLRPQPVAIVWMGGAWRRATTSTVNAADPPTTHSRRLATLPCPLCSGRASGRVSEALCGVYGVSVTFHHQTLLRA